MNTGNKSNRDIIEPRLHLVAWEITRRCNLFCAHCRASSEDKQYEDELSIQECYQLIDEIIKVGKPILILTGGEPLARPDVLQIAKYGVSKGLKVVMGTNGTLISRGSRVKESSDIPPGGKPGLSYAGASGRFPR